LIDHKNKVRVRACGLLIEEDSLLLVELYSPVSNELIWTAPGGGVEFGESLEETVTREFKEETGIKVKTLKLIHINELINGDFHAIEFYYLVEKISGTLKLGVDPEYKSGEQILKNIAYLKKEEIQKLNVSPKYLKDDLWKDLKF